MFGGQHRTVWAAKMKFWRVPWFQSALAADVANSLTFPKPRRSPSETRLGQVVTNCGVTAFSLRLRPNRTIHL